MIKTFNQEIDELFSDVKLPSDQQIREETAKAKRAEGIRAVKDKIGESVKNSEAYKQGMANRDQSFRNDPKYQQAHRQRMQKIHQDSQWRENHRKGLENLRNDPEKWSEYQKKYQQGNTAKYDNPKYWENYYRGIERRDSDPEYHKRRIAASNAKLAIKISTPDGEFDSISDAARHYGMTSEGMRNRVKSDKYPDFKKIEK